MNTINIYQEILIWLKLSPYVSIKTKIENELKLLCVFNRTNEYILQLGEFIGF